MDTQAIRQLVSRNKVAAATNASLIANALVWYTFAFNYLNSFNPSETSDTVAVLTQPQFLQIMIVHFAVLFSSILIGEYVSRKAKGPFNFLRLWLLIGIFLSLTLLPTGATYWGLMIFSLVVAANFGFGVPAILSYFASTTLPSNRGKVGGGIFLLTGLSVFILSVLFSTLSEIIGNSVLIVSLMLILWRTLSFLFFNFWGPKDVLNAPKEPSNGTPKDNFSYRQILTNRTFLLYFVPWMIFLFINSMSFPINTVAFGQDKVLTGGRIEFVLTGISAVIFGFFADAKGRKRLAVAGFAILGLGYAILGFTAPNVYGWWIYTAIDGISWGILIVIFLFTIWGDIAEGRKFSKIYAIGVMPYLLISLIRILTGDSLENYFAIQMKDGMGLGTIFSFFSFFLFIAVLPLVIAPETMSEQTIRNNDLKSYIEKAKKQVQKKEKKESHDDSSKSEDGQAQTNEDQSDEYKEAQKLAEKYY